MDIEKTIKDLERRLSMLEDRAASQPVGQPQQGRTFAVEKLSSAWADKAVKFDPKFWKGESLVGKTYSVCPPDYLDQLASGLDYRVKKAQGDATPKLDNKGNPFWKRDEFEAMLLRTWAKAKREGTAPVPAVVGDDGLSDPLPF